MQADEQEQSAIIAYCKSQRLIDNYLAECETERKELIMAKKTYGDLLKTYMKDNHLSCVPVEIKDEGKITVWMQYKQNTVTKPLQDDTFREAVTNIGTPELKAVLCELKDDSPPPAQIWVLALRKEITRQLQKKSYSFSLKSKRPQKHVNIETIVPNSIQSYVQNLYDSQMALRELNERIADYKSSIATENETNQDVIMSFLRKFQPSKRSQKINFSFEVSKDKKIRETRFLRLKERRRVKPVRMKTANKIMMDVMAQVVSTNPIETLEDSVCGDTFREALIGCLEQEYQNEKMSRVEIFEELTLDRGRRQNIEITGDDEFEDTVQNIY